MIGRNCHGCHRRDVFLLSNFLTWSLLVVLLLLRVISFLLRLSLSGWQRNEVLVRRVVDHVLRTNNDIGRLVAADTLIEVAWFLQSSRVICALIRNRSFGVFVTKSDCAAVYWDAFLLFSIERNAAWGKLGAKALTMKAIFLPELVTVGQYTLSMVPCTLVLTLLWHSEGFGWAISERAIIRVYLGQAGALFRYFQREWASTLPFMRLYFVVLRSQRSDVWSLACTLLTFTCQWVIPWVLVHVLLIFDSLCYLQHIFEEASLRFIVFNIEFNHLADSFLLLSFALLLTFLGAKHALELSCHRW